MSQLGWSAIGLRTLVVFDGARSLRSRQVVKVFNTLCAKRCATDNDRNLPLTVILLRRPRVPLRSRFPAGAPEDRLSGRRSP